MDTRERFIQKQTQKFVTWSVKDKDGQKKYDNSIKQAEKDYETYLASQNEGDSSELQNEVKMLKEKFKSLNDAGDIRDKELQEIGKQLKEAEKLQIAYDKLKGDSENLVKAHNKLEETNKLLEETHKKAMKGKNDEIDKYIKDIIELKKM